ncbi:MAG: MBL fold metallo-hydrolase [Halothiobacillaceae bacterium]
MKLTSHGGAERVTGSKHLLEAGGRRVLIDCGMFQGEKAGRLLNWQAPPFDPASIDAVLLTHAHLDHCGYLPRLVRSGFRGPVYATRATREVARIIMLDAAHLQEEDAAKANLEGWSRHRPAKPLYDTGDVDAVLARFHCVAPGEPLSLFEGALHATFHPAGHILGACGIEIDDGSSRIWFSGDIGRHDDLLMYPPSPPSAVDTVVMESTYGDRLHTQTDPVAELTDMLARMHRQRGVLLVPAFAVGRAQLVMLLLDRIMRARPDLDMPVYLSSPMASRVFEVYREFHDLHRITPEELDRVASRVRMVDHGERAARLNRKRHGPMVIIAGAGMLTGGRILSHLAAHAGRSENLVLLTGFQAPDTRGDRLLRGERDLKVQGRRLHVQAEVVLLDGLSAHADQAGLVDWLCAAPRLPERVLLVHGEPLARAALAQRIHERTGRPCASLGVGRTVMV